MDICFLFSKHIDEQGCFSLKISTENKLIAPPAKRSFAEIKLLQEDSKTWIIESSLQASILEVELPWLSDTKARIAIPYALEDKLAQPIEELHFAFDKAHYQNNHYTVAVMDKNRLSHLMQLFNQHEIDYELITLDWFALKPGEIVFNETVLLVHEVDFKGALTNELAATYLKNRPDLKAFVFLDSKPPKLHSQEEFPEDSYTWMAGRLFQANPLNLCQGAMAHATKMNWIHKGYKLAALLGAVWLVSLILVNSINLYFLNKRTEAVDQQIAQIYHHFFPEAKQVISPKFRISQLLQDKSVDTGRFWFLLNKCASALKDSPIKLEQLRFQNKILSITVVSSDFSSLEGLENTLKKQGLKLTQTQASTQDNQVLATLELM